MKTTTTGTLSEWMSHDPDAMLINRKIKFMSNGAYVYSPSKSEEPEMVTYESLHKPNDYTDYAEPHFLIGRGCPYVIKFKHEYFVSIGTVYGSGVPKYPISERHWNDPNWEKIDKIEDCDWEGVI
jgi:hypothetical protein